MQLIFSIIFLTFLGKNGTKFHRKGSKFHEFSLTKKNRKLNTVNWESCSNKILFVALVLFNNSIRGTYMRWLFRNRRSSVEWLRFFGSKFESIFKNTSLRACVKCPEYPSNISTMVVAETVCVGIYQRLYTNLIFWKIRKYKKENIIMFGVWSCSYLFMHFFSLVLAIVVLHNGIILNNETR